MDDWIFSDEAHEWMDSIRVRVGSIHQRSIYDFGEELPRQGWEYGLFGFKNVEHSNGTFEWVAAESWGTFP